MPPGKPRANADARRHIRERRQLTEITAGLDGLVIDKFLALDDLRRDSLLLTYRTHFGESEASWAIKALPKWRTKPKNISGVVGARLLYLLPVFLTEEEQSSLLKQWQDSWTLSHALPATGPKGFVPMLRLCEGNQKMADEILLAVGQRRLCKLPGAPPAVPPPQTPTQVPHPLTPAPTRPTLPLTEHVERIAGGVSPPEPAAAQPSIAPAPKASGTPGLPSTFTAAFLAVLVLVVLVAVALHPDAPAGSAVQPTPTPTPTPSLPSPSKVDSWNEARQRAIAEYPDVANPDSPLGRAVRQEIEDLKKADSAELQAPDAPLAITHRVADRLAQPLAVEINFVQKQNRNDPHSHIEFVGGYNRDGTMWRLPLTNAVAAVQAGKYAFYVAQGGSRVQVIVSTSRDGNLFLKTVADGKAANNLLSLPDFPR